MIASPVAILESLANIGRKFSKQTFEPLFCVTRLALTCNPNVVFKAGSVWRRQRSIFDHSSSENANLAQEEVFVLPYSGMLEGPLEITSFLRPVGVFPWG